MTFRLNVLDELLLKFGSGGQAIDPRLGLI